MIVKAKRVKARGAALNRLLRHVTDGDDNDCVELLQGNIAELKDARDDAIRLGREYAVRHWILSPEIDLTPEQFGYLIALLATEFGFDWKQAVVWKHRKLRASGIAGAEHCISDEHYHVLVRECDAITGHVLSNSHSFRRHEKLARIAEVHWRSELAPTARQPRHGLTSGAHNRAVASFLAGGEHDHVAKAMAAAGLLHGERPAQSFTETEHQRAKRVGLDLPRLTVIVSDAFFASTSLADFEAKLAAVGLRWRNGEKVDTPVVETVDGELVGSLARLTRLRKKALLERMKAYGSRSVDPIRGSAAAPPVRPKSERGDGAVAENCHQQDNPGVEPSRAGHESGSAGPDIHRHPTAAAIDRGHRSDFEPARSSRSQIEGSEPATVDLHSRSRLSLALGCSAQLDTLLDLVAVARRCALPQLEKVVSDCDAAIERNTGVINGEHKLAEPDSLVAAKKAAAAHREVLQRLQAESETIETQLSALPPSTWWRRLFFRAQSRTRSALSAKLSKRQAETVRAEAESSRARSVLVEEERLFKVAQRQHAAEVSKAIELAKQACQSAAAAKSLLQKNPELAGLGSTRLFEMATQAEKARIDHQSLIGNEEPSEQAIYSLP